VHQDKWLLLISTPVHVEHLYAVDLDGLARRSIDDHLKPLLLLPFLQEEGMQTQAAAMASIFIVDP
jgi:hypothetical protein